MNQAGSYQNMLKEVEQIVADLNRQDVNLDDLVQKVERGYSLIKSMKQRLQAAKMQVEELKRDHEGAPASEVAQEIAGDEAL